MFSYSEGYLVFALNLLIIPNCYICCRDSTVSAIQWAHTKKGKRKAQGMPQLQTAALPRPQEEEETDKSKQAQTEQTYAKH